MTGSVVHVAPMTTHTNRPTSSPDLDAGSLDAADPRLPFAKAVALAGTVIDTVRPDQLADATPCDEYDVRQLTGHLVYVLHRVAAVGRGQDLVGVPDVVDGVPDDRWLDAWSDAAHDVQAVWSEPGILDRMMVLPFATLPGAAMMALYTSEVTTHTWDLATATGQQPAWDDDVVAVALAAMQRALPPDARGPGVPFDEVVPVGEDAPLIDQLVAWNGRRP